MPLIFPFCMETDDCFRKWLKYEFQKFVHSVFHWKKNNLWTDSFQAVQKFVCEFHHRNWCLLDSTEPVFVQLPILKHPAGFMADVQRRAVQDSAGGGPVQNITPMWLVSNWLPVKFACLHLNSPVTDTDPPWIMSALTELLLHTATVQGYPEVFCRASVKFRVFQYLICKILGNSTATGVPSESHKTWQSWVFYTVFMFKSRPTQITILVDGV